MINNNKKQMILTAVLIIAVLAAVFVVWKTNPVDYSVFITDNISYVRGKVVSVNSEELEDSTDTPGRNVGIQNITVKYRRDRGVAGIFRSARDSRKREGRAFSAGSDRFNGGVRIRTDTAHL